jgi:2-haloacid dehalogenase
MKKDIFLVDADNTLLDFNASSFLAIEEALKSYGFAWEEKYKTIFLRLNDGLWERLERKELTREKLHEIRFPMYLKELGIEGIDGNEFNKKYLQYLAEKPVYIDGAEAFLKELKKNGRVFIVTNGTEWIQNSRFKILDFWALIDGAFISQAIGADKPDPIFTNYVLSHIEDFDKDRAVLIGDSLSADIKMANDAKIESIWYNPMKKPVSEKTALHNYTASNFEEILSILGIK